MSKLKESEILLRVDNIKASYGSRPVIDGISLEVGRGEIVAVLGPNGSGKTTMLKAIFGLLKPFSGKVIFAEENIVGCPPHRNVMRGLGLSLQSGSIFQDLTVLENLEVSCHMGGSRLLAGHIKRILHAFPALKLHCKKRAGLLSGGEKQLLTLGMLMIREPRLLLLDEPSSGLAPDAAAGIINSVKEVSKTFGVSVLLVEQNIKQALAVADRVCALKNGRMFKEETPEEFIINKTYEKLFLA